ncbi:hypothetical protein [Autumnicola musiva]|uniref:Nucleotide-diphospho-sugar transferase domain-containing protein n=1 Tax=Autumnicola musiva TaxID=3075589 RepID=A0ABU3D2T0_9FLAO|nr:hypothetical protein [Zunongwangia sp. F117]MDT0675836.1 hypothetical protein [Zunongwangia sp. F117]
MITITTLACHRDIAMVQLSLKSFVHNYKDDYRVHVYEDGSLTESDKEKLLSISGVTIKDKKEVDALADEALRNHPYCRQWRGQNAFTIKLFDMAVMENTDYVYFDSDVFFIKPFVGLERSKFGNEDLVLMSDRFDYYSVNYFERFIYPRMKFPDKINAGFYYLRNGAIDFDLFEWLFSKEEFFPKDKDPWRVSLADQTAWALLGANCNAAIWKKDQVLIPASENEIKPDTIGVHLIKRLEGFQDIYKNVEELIHRENSEIDTLYTQKLSFSNPVSAALEKLKFKFTENK